MPDAVPPSDPPPLLSRDQLDALIKQGHLQLTLKPELVELYGELSTASLAFFARSVEEKRQLYPQGQGTELGYYSVEDEKEYVTLRHARSDDQQPGQPTRVDESLERIAGELWRQTALLFKRILSDLSTLLSIDFAAWKPVLDGCCTLPNSQQSMTPTLLRLFRYLPTTGVAEPHGDLGLLTLCVGSGKGLQVWSGTAEEGEWVDAEGPTLLAGRTLTTLSGQRVAGGLHRVVGNPEGRTSIVFALRPSNRRMIPMTPFGGWGEIDGREFWKIIKDGVRNINATKDIRERQQLAQRWRTEKEQQAAERWDGASKEASTTILMSFWTMSAGSQLTKSR